MAINQATRDVLGDMRVQLDHRVDSATRALVSAWVRAWDEIGEEWQAAVEAIFNASKDGQWPSYSQLSRLDRVKRAAEVTREHLEALTSITGVTVKPVISPIVSASLDWERQLVNTQLPPTPQGVTGSVNLAFNRVDDRQVEAIVKRTTQQITSLTRGLTPASEDAMKQVLTKGILFGDNPRAAAAEMLARTEGAFDGGLTRALVISRTEMIDAARAGGMAADLANPQLVTGWYWDAVLDQRTCPSCWSQHGSLHPADEQGPNDHQSGRCARVPTTVSWADLGFDIPEPPPLITDAEATFNNLPDAQQLAIMGPARLELLNSGDVSWSDLSQRRVTDGWRDSYAPRPVSKLRALVPA